MDSSTRSTERDIARQKFAEAFSTWRNAQAGVAGWNANTGSTDEAVSAANKMLDEAIRIVLATPAVLPYQLFHKFEVVDDLVTRERIEGESSANFPAMGMASLKIDLMNLTEIMKAAEIPA